MSLTSYRAAPPRDKLRSKTLVLIVSRVIRRIAKTRLTDKLRSKTLVLIVLRALR